MLAAWEHPDRIKPARVLRMTLRGPVTLGHVLFLHEIGSPIVSGEQFSIGDLGLAVMVCLEPNAKAAKRSIRSKLAGFSMRMWSGLCGRLNFEEESEKFSTWFMAQCGGPEQKVVIKEGQAPSAPLSAPWYINKLASAVGELGLSIEEASALPVKTLNQLIGALSESRGNAEFLRQDEADFFENVKKWEAEKAKT